MKKNLASSINKEKKLLEVRKELLTGYQIPKSNYIVTQPGRSAVTVNNYMTNLNAVFQFGVDNGYLADNPFKGDLAIKGIKNHSGSSFAGRIYPSYRCVQKSASKKIYGVFLFILEFATGELCALGWEDIDLKKWNNDDQEKFSKRPFHGTKNTGGNQSGHSSY